MIRLARLTDAEQVLAIYAPVVRDTPISFEWEVPSLEEVRARMRKVLEFRPWLVYERADEVLGYVYATTFRERRAYNWGSEVSVYIRADAQRLGLARKLYLALFDLLRLQGYCNTVAGATVPNAASERLHERMGFRLIGRYPAAGYKFGRWHDVVFWYLPLRPMPEAAPQLKSVHEIIGGYEFAED